MIDDLRAILRRWGSPSPSLALDELGMLQKSYEVYRHQSVPFARRYCKCGQSPTPLDKLSSTPNYSESSPEVARGGRAACVLKSG